MSSSLAPAETKGERDERMSASRYACHGTAWMARPAGLALTVLMFLGLAACGVPFES
jgi:hypothetical protein